jgi:cytochrome oxidase Cu insertion factor (SCO1/SenC/PrrC family)
MKRKSVSIACTAIGIVSVLLALTVSIRSTAAPKIYVIGQKIANFALKDDRGKTVSLSQYRGQVIILNFYASW